MILPNAANQCPTCLAQEFNLTERLQRGPAGQKHIVIHQCRNCRRFARTPTRYEFAEHESPELLSICLKHIPALNQHDLQLVDASWIWTEPHCMRLKVRLTVRTELLSVVVQQRVMVELHVQFQMCPECNRDFTNRTWHALVQVRQVRNDSKKGLAALEMALAKNKTIRQHVLKVDTKKNGFDFYFLSNTHAQTFTNFLQRVAAMRIQRTTKMVSADNHSNTANMKTTFMAQMVPLCRDDLVLIHRKAAGSKLAGSLAIVTKVSSTIQFVGASPKRTHVSDSMMELSADQYYKTEKHYQMLQAGHRLVRFVVLDVELCDEQAPSGQLYEGPHSGVEKYALADVTVARESDFGVNDEMFACVTHLGHWIAAGDVVLGYDLVNSVGTDDWEMQEQLHGGFTLPDVVLVKKAPRNKETAAVGVDEQEGQKRMTKKRERRKRYKEGRKQKELEETAGRMGFFDDINEEQVDEEGEDVDADFEAELANDPELAAELLNLERDLAQLDDGDVVAEGEDNQLVEEDNQDS
jgi:nonsense-mediated mRNA decay protein 3